jgi:hypothetical protein
VSQDPNSTLQIYGQNDHNPSTFVNVDGDISYLTKTNAYVAWPWNSVDDRDVDQRAPNINSVIQEIVSQQGQLAGGNYHRQR